MYRPLPHRANQGLSVADILARVMHLRVTGNLFVMMAFSLAPALAAAMLQVACMYDQIYMVDGLSTIATAWDWGHTFMVQRSVPGAAVFTILGQRLVIITLTP